jgi:hypothetical protein
MAVEYPDVMNDIIDARQRYESGGVQYLSRWSAPAVSAGDTAQLTLVLQSVMDVPVRVALQLALPEPRGKLRRLPQPLFRIFQPNIQLTLADGEVAQLVIPVYVQPHVPGGEYEFTMHVRSESEQQGARVRSERGEDRLGDLKIHHPQGLGITQIAPCGFVAEKAERQRLALTVREGEELDEAAKQPEDVDLRPQFQSLWTREDLDLIAPARREVNERRTFAVPELTTVALYLPFMKESQATFADCGVQLHISEAVFVTKILTHTVTYMMGNAEWQDCLLVPIYAYAQANEQPTNDALWLVTQLGYMHVVELAIALSFSLVEEMLQREPWDLTEQGVLRNFIVECLNQGAELPVEFLYLPLILGGIAVADKVVLKGETVSDSLRLLGGAKAERSDLFADPDLHELNEVFDRLVAMQSSR